MGMVGIWVRGRRGPFQRIFGFAVTLYRIKKKKIRENYAVKTIKKRTKIAPIRTFSTVLPEVLVGDHFNVSSHGWACRGL